MASSGGILSVGVTRAQAKKMKTTMNAGALEKYHKKIADIERSNSKEKSFLDASFDKISNSSSKVFHGTQNLLGLGSSPSSNKGAGQASMNLRKGPNKLPTFSENTVSRVGWFVTNNSSDPNAQHGRRGGTSSARAPKNQHPQIISATSTTRGSTELQPLHPTSSTSRAASPPTPTNIDARRETIFREADSLRISLQSRSNQYVINPDDSRFAATVQTTSAIFLVVVCFFTPYEAALLDLEIGGFAFWFSRVIDFVFFVDLVMHFFLMYRVNTVAGRQILIVSQGKIAMNYIKTWFIVDFLAVFPFWIFELAGYTFTAQAGEGSGLLRALRLLRLGKIMKSMKFVRDKSIHIQISHSLSLLLQFLCVLVLAAHWLACVWAAYGVRAGGDFFVNGNLVNYSGSSGTGSTSSSGGSVLRSRSLLGPDMSDDHSFRAADVDYYVRAEAQPGAGTETTTHRSSSRSLSERREQRRSSQQDDDDDLQFDSILPGLPPAAHKDRNSEQQEGKQANGSTATTTRIGIISPPDEIEISNEDALASSAALWFDYFRNDPLSYLTNPLDIQAWGTRKSVGDSFIFSAGAPEESSSKNPLSAFSVDEAELLADTGGGETETSIEERTGVSRFLSWLYNFPFNIADESEIDVGEEEEELRTGRDLPRQNPDATTTAARSNTNSRTRGPSALDDTRSFPHTKNYEIDNSEDSFATQQLRRHLRSLIEFQTTPHALPSTGRRRVSWVQEYCECTVCSSPLTCQQCNSCLGNAFQIYVGALHYSLMTLTSIGYGDIVPTHTGERFIACLIMFIAGVTWASIVGFACGLISHRTAEDRKFIETIDDLNRMMREKDVDESLRKRLRQFFQHTKDIGESQQSYEKIFKKMSPTLQAEVAITMHAAFMLRVVFLSDVDYDLLAAICMALKPITYAQGEPIGDSQVLYVMRAGVTLVNNCVYRVGGCWGEDILLDHPDLVSFYSGFAMTYVEASAISRKQLNDVLLKFPEQSSRIRRHKVQLAVQRTLMRAAQERLLQMMLTAGRKESLLLQKEQQQQLRDSTGENINGDVGLVGGDANTNPSTFQSQQQAQQLRSNSTNYRASATQSRSYAILKQKWKNSFFSFRIENRQEQMNLKQFHSTRKAVEEQNELCTKHVIESMLENVKTNILTEVNGYVREKIEKQRSKSAGSGSGGPRGRSSKRSGNIANSEEVENEEMGALQDLTDAGSSPVGGGGPHFQATTSNAPAAPVAGPRSRTSGSSKKTKTPPARDPPPQAPPPLVKIPKVVLVRDVQAPRVDLAEKNASTTTSHQMQQNKLLKPPAPPPAPMLASLPPGAKTMQRKETSTKSGTESFEPKLILEDEEEEAEASFFQVAGRGDDSSDE